MKMPIPAKFEKTEMYERVKQDLLLHRNEFKQLKKELDSIDDRDVCPTCGQAIDNLKARQMKVDLKNRIYITESSTRLHEDNIKILEEEIRVVQREQRAYAINQRAIEDFEQLTQLITTLFLAWQPVSQSGHLREGHGEQRERRIDADSRAPLVE